MRKMIYENKSYSSLPHVNEYNQPGSADQISIKILLLHRLFLTSNIFLNIYKQLKLNQAPPSVWAHFLILQISENYLFIYFYKLPVS